MLVHDPIAHIQRPLSEFLVESRKDDYVVLRSANGSGTFRLNLRTMTSSDPAALPVARLQESVTASVVEALDGVSLPLVEGVDDPSILKAVFVCGAGGSGKTKVGNTMFAGMGFKFINQDTHLEKMLKAAKIPLSQVGMHYGLQKKAQGLKNAETRQYGLRRLGMVIDATGWDYERIAGPAKQLMKLGYDVYMVFVTTTLETALRRNADRERVVPADFVKTAHTGAHKNLPEFQKLIGRQNVFVIQNNDDFSDATWDRVAAPALRKIGSQISKAAVKNRIGKAWIEARMTDGKDAVDTTEWPKTEKKSLIPSPIPSLPKAKQKPSLTAEQAAAKTPRKWMMPSLLEVDGGVAVPPELEDKEKIGTYDGCTVYVVDGNEVRAHLTDFEGGGHYYAYPGLIPKNEIWVERHRRWLDTAAIAVHELTEYTRMRYAKEKYKPAHTSSNDVEAIIRALIKKAGVNESIDTVKGTKLEDANGSPLLMYYCPRHTLDDVLKSYPQDSVAPCMVGQPAGPGFAFTSSPPAFNGQEWAVLPAYLLVEKVLRADAKLTDEQIGSLIEAAPGFDAVAEPADPAKRLAKAVAEIREHGDTLHQVADVWQKWYEDYQAPLFAEAMVKIGFDSALRVQDTGVVLCVMFDESKIIPESKGIVVKPE